MTIGEFTFALSTIISAWISLPAHPFAFEFGFVVLAFRYQRTIDRKSLACLKVYLVSAIEIAGRCNGIFSHHLCSYLHGSVDLGGGSIPCPFGLNGIVGFRTHSH